MSTSCVAGDRVYQTKQTSGGKMTNTEAIKALEEMKAFAGKENIDALDYAIEVLKLLDGTGYKDPIEAFKKENKL